jgi:predicted ferric reductase/Ca2+-binding EF-hand superfamily protein
MAAGKGGPVAPPEDDLRTVSVSERPDRAAPPLHSDIRDLAPAAFPHGPVDRLAPADEELLDGLEAALRDPSGADRRLDAREVARILGIRSQDLARRIVAVLGGDDSGSIRADAMLAGVKRLLYGDSGERRRFAFRIHDLDEDGTLDRAELARMIALGCVEDDVAVREGVPDRLAINLIKHADRSRDGRISLGEFNDALDRHPQVAAAIEKSGARWLVVNEAAADRLEAPDPLTSRLKRALENRRAYVLFLGLWGAANVILFARAWHTFAAGGLFVQAAHGCGACLNFNGALILLPVMRRVLTRVRATRFRALVPLDDAIELHAVAGHAMFALALIHTAAHMVNFARKPGATMVHELFWPGPGRTGLLWLTVFAVMWLFARASARARQKFELFHTSHLLYVVWFAIGVLHGPVFWKWVTVPIAAFVIERLVRFARRSTPTEIVQTRVLRSGVTRLDLRRPQGFEHQAGDFVFLRIPCVARHEWHPLTISSAPERATLSLHVRARGDWTAAVRRFAETRRSGHSSDAITAFIDGPYGAPSTDVFQSRRAVLIAGGIGVTPFASVLESMVLRAGAGAASTPDRVDFVWLNRDQYSFEWFVDLLASLERLDRRGLVHVHAFMTGGRADAVSAAFDLARQASFVIGEPDVVTGLRFETHMGAPDWRELLGAIAREAGGEPVNVYFCGPPGLARKIAPACAEVGMTFRQERF